MGINRYRHNIVTAQATEGWTILEIMVVAAIIGIVSAIAIPSWLSFIDRQRLNTAQNQVYRAMQQAKSNAVKDKLTWQVSFREYNGVVQWAVHSEQSGQFIPTNVQWHNLAPNVQVDKARNNKGKCETTLDEQPQRCPTIGPWRVQFNHHGNTNGQLGQITLISKNGGKIKRCVYVSTLIGAKRTGQERSQPNSNDKYCY
jgi:Tfp pilus assembly protein FimT